MVGEPLSKRKSHISPESKRRMKTIALAIFTLINLLWAEAVFGVERVRFLVIGDLPYNAEQARVLEAEIRPEIVKRKFPFVIHVGDFKSGGWACSDRGLEAAHEQITSLLPGRVIYTPGDNDWTDCDRSKLGKPISELKRLRQLRDIFFGSSAPQLPQWQFRRQPRYPENAMWRFKGIQFATLHVVGTNNGRIEIELDNISDALDAVDARDEANQKWLDAAFVQARKPGVAALIVAMQADITRVRYRGPCTPENRSKCDAFRELRSTFRSASAKLGKPVLVVHGDTGRYCIDRDFGGDKAPNLWRLNSAGDWIVEASEIVVDATNRKRPFSIFRLLRGTELEALC